MMAKERKLKKEKRGEVRSMIKRVKSRFFILKATWHSATFWLVAAKRS